MRQSETKYETKRETILARKPVKKAEVTKLQGWVLFLQDAQQQFPGIKTDRDLLQQPEGTMTLSSSPSMVCHLRICASSCGADTSHASHVQCRGFKAGAGGREQHPKQHPMVLA
jgi:hypothetical protein